MATDRRGPHRSTPVNLFGIEMRYPLRRGEPLVVLFMRLGAADVLAHAPVTEGLHAESVRATRVPPRAPFLLTLRIPSVRDRDTLSHGSRVNRL
jgi:hypothetical protein